MQVRNNYDIPYTRPDGGEEGAGAFNGDMGVIVDVDVRGGSVTVRSEDRLLVYTAEHVRELEPAYAVTIHKSQGSEFPAVIIPVMDVPPKLCYRNLLYTGVTRAKTLCILAGHSAEVAQMDAQRAEEQTVFLSGRSDPGRNAVNRGDSSLKKSKRLFELCGDILFPRRCPFCDAVLGFSGPCAVCGRRWAWHTPSSKAAGTEQGHALEHLDAGVCAVFL